MDRINSTGMSTAIFNVLFGIFNNGVDKMDKQSH
ncbi:hypothetical protein Cpin_6883 [Chitinophaga pinensis DSM 2588]|uniref:Uncharacterized protein n=1 Tax=Chitinophaga pinensis (strain ATCC 43595 / DSM 2588 / LMG 13176 / NBRC 15968 / NCIMB 11800 / UQM 2034) TaxID=485918 RepID=A0A979GB53_CHIPD|nr:hypothetical protein Cpin_6883 [Chitinophaga pinensis DSM 2588]